MQKFFLLATLMIFCVTSSVDAATPIKNHPRIAVAEFANKTITSEGFRDQDYLYRALVNAAGDKFPVKLSGFSSITLEISL